MSRPDSADDRESVDALRQALARERARSEMLSGMVSRLQHAVYRMVVPKGHYEYFSRGAADVFGYPAQEFLDRPMLIREILHPDFHAYFEEQWDELLEGRVPAGYEYKTIDSEGEERWISQTNRGIYDDHGKIVAIEGCCSNITDRKRMEQALRDSVEWASIFVTSSPMGIFIYELRENGDLIFNAANPAADLILGTECHRFYGKTIEEAFPPLAETEIPEAYRAVARDGEPWSKEQIDYRDGEIQGAFKVHAFQAAPGRTAVLFEDITPLKKATAELESLRALLLAAVEQTPAGVLIADAPDARIRVANSAALGIRGQSPSTLTDIPLELHPAHWQVFHLDGRPCAPEELPLSRAILSGETVRNEELVIRRGDGDERRVLANAAPVRDADGEIVAGVVVFPDITEARDLERQMRHSQKLESLGVLAGGIAHDFNNLLCGILGSAELALLTLDPGHTARENLDTVREASLTATELCRQLLAYSGKGRFAVAPLDLASLVEGMSQLLRVSVSRTIALSFNLADDVPSVEADATQIRQVLLNLVVNAAEAIGEGPGTVQVGVGLEECDRTRLSRATLGDGLEPGPYVALVVTDTGRGMDEDTRAKIFDPFFTTKFTGRGLGLAALQGIVRGHAGAILLDSEPGRGTEFRILLPVSEKPVEAPAGKEDDGSWRGHGRVLLVDDEESVRRVARTMLGRLGFDVILAGDGEEALAIYENLRDELALVLLDVTMPRLDGRAALEQMRARDDSVPVILMSGYDKQATADRFSGKGRIGFIQKPFSLGALAEAVRHAVEA